MRVKVAYVLATSREEARKEASLCCRSTRVVEIAHDDAVVGRKELVLDDVADVGGYRVGAEGEAILSNGDGDGCGLREGAQSRNGC